ncbi:MAG: endolytic transglycosylase MltG [Clostridia bacterium]|nr:endolytic transglycosylase MltG [Clostridia bacterium]
MEQDKRMNDEWDSLLSDLDDTLRETDSSATHIDLEQSASRTSPNTAYVSFENEEAAPDATAAFTVPSPPDFDVTKAMDGLLSPVPTQETDDVKVFDSSEPSAECATDDAVSKTTVIAATQVLPEAKKDAVEDKTPKGKKNKNEAMGCLKSLIYMTIVLVLAIILGYFSACAVIDVMGLYNDGTELRITVEEGDGTQEIAQLLEEKDIIDYPLVFRVFCKFKGDSAAFHPGDFVVRRGMDYNALINTLSQGEMLETVTVMIPEGTTLEGIAAILEKNEVCTEEQFFDGLESFDYDQYDFFKEIPQEKRANRTYLAEGYLFPDTYEFYVNDAATSVIGRMIDNFEVRSKDAFDSIRASGRTVDDVIIAASIVQQEAGDAKDMPRVMRVIENRLANPSSFPRLEMDSTQDYLDGLDNVSGDAYQSSYDTYKMQGMPSGAICNPGLQAINAAINPSQEPDILNCFYFASVISTGETKFSETFAEHEAWCIEHGVGVYGD